MLIKFESEIAKRTRQKQWHRWFAWRPIRVDDQHLVWLQYIERRRLGEKWYSYRLGETNER